MNLNLFLFHFACILHLFNYIPNLLASPVIGGEEDTDHFYKFHVSLRHTHDHERPYSGKHFCGGAIVHDSYVLSAAHCFVTMNGESIVAAFYPRTHGIVVVAGTSETMRGLAIIMQVNKIFIPGEFNRGVPFYADISILKLEGSLNTEQNSNKVTIIPMDEGQYSLDFFVNKRAIILGNGHSSLVDGREVERVANRRQVLQVRVTPRGDSCPQYDYAICAINRDNTCIRTCSPGDSGSPLVYDGTVIGVLSVGCDNVLIRHPIVCTRTSRFMIFIWNAMDENGDHREMYTFEN